MKFIHKVLAADLYKVVVEISGRITVEIPANQDFPTKEAAKKKVEKHLQELIVQAAEAGDLVGKVSVSDLGDGSSKGH